VSSFVTFAVLYLASGNPIAALSGGRPLPPGSVQILENGTSFLSNVRHFTRPAVTLPEI
jgi:hypothetical protein